MHLTEWQGDNGDKLFPTTVWVKYVTWYLLRNYSVNKWLILGTEARSIGEREMETVPKSLYESSKNPGK